MKREQKSLTNKGFSLVELIIVVAIMAVLIGVLAPQYLRYVEKTRLQKDNTSISEVANVLKISSAEEKVISSFPTAGATYTFDSNGVLQLSGVTDLDNEVTATITVGDVKLTSNKYKGAYPTIKVEIDSTTKIIKVSATGWYDTPSDTTTIVKTF